MPQRRLSPLELRRLPLSGEVVALGSGDGSGCDPEAAREAFPLRISMTCGKMRVTRGYFNLYSFSLSLPPNTPYPYPLQGVPVRACRHLLCFVTRFPLTASFCYLACLRSHPSQADALTLRLRATMRGVSL